MARFDDLAEQAAGLLARARHAIALTGAGVSVPSGIPHFRSPHGLWTRFDIREYGTIQAFLHSPRKVWRLFAEIAAVVERAKPNPGHIALARLEALGVLKGLVTQNIDSLHTQAGTRKIVEFHGSTRYLHCVSCQQRYPSDQWDALTDREGIPVCQCGFVLKPEVILFGESIPEDAIRTAYDWASRSDLILVVGTSAEVAPASLLPAVVASTGGAIVEMNIGPTQLSSQATCRIVGDVSETLPALMSDVETLLRKHEQ